MRVIQSTAGEGEMPSINELLTQSEAGRLRGVSREAIADLIRRGRLRSVKFCGRALVYRRDIEELQRLKPGPKKNAGLDTNSEREAAV
jgi:excisionase family DNA binding protein